ncbi:MULTISPECIES: [NiFe]-hydrogenase assembly chaperone HybE [unclassified Pseudomonas]|uniref:[NiFe]-hydrogenase assembly chaperone HybE n=1 Tax=unclassified Pseudomonas TaxID=196821 RepID=UPI002AC90240|nr:MULTISPECIES: [NiFe]-hydrogenase assembly chaperone HybE [unclassified Pseudomonas]MEB0041116.1 [NiFe]-hydrogenase assembly chaperone HybE [Pseudomonas sp. MH10]MEB0078563.1 [NiFe]-hydrogenase assembly chaperone HybE [Pseudomonas sp. MH10out]MEB0092137.1 [NiFe]-hydrogenase assembly chaperone HybE [Pseudomonas sp. CCI4.2]MEB0100378.1 [NiFe]-hydrogenase assembly chaperone HybE [Pseudomonas sp. CCI3.2]MEB0120300.1 [NiFe]-hydrogenase assembly chaperone HybE [Pseudomonas sp. CCI1.2]
MTQTELPDTAQLRGEELAAHFRDIADTRMRGLPFLNPVLEVEAVGFSTQIASEDASCGVLGILITPWFMNLMWLAPALSAPLAQGASREHLFGGQHLTFIGAVDEDFGTYESCSLFSPVFEFADQAAARATAEQVLLLLRGPVEEEKPQPHPALSRRSLLFGRLSGDLQ